jgi:hypothetical protein
MISEQKQETLLRPFQNLMNQFQLELEAAREVHFDWQKAKSLSNTASEIADNDELADKIQQLDKGRSEVEKFIQGLEPRLQVTEVAFEEIVDELRTSAVGFTLLFKNASALLNYKYTVIQKNEINRRITAVNSSGILNNTDMEALQKLWTTLLATSNDKRMISTKVAFEDRLTAWENLIVQKKRSR